MPDDLNKNKVRFEMLPELEELLDRDAATGTAGIAIPGEREGRVILIIGPPGSGKSTLALQMAWGLTVGGRPAHTLYFPLEQSVEQLKKIAAGFKWDGLERLQSAELTPEELKRQQANPHVADWFQCICAKGKGRPTENAQPWDYASIIVPKVSPRKKIASSGPELFERRLTDVHAVLDGYCHCRAKFCREATVTESCCQVLPSTCQKGNIDCLSLGMVVIYSLNVFGDQELTRDQIFSLCDLVVRYGTIGVIVAEERIGVGDEAAGSTQFDPAEYVADVVIRLSHHRDNGHLINTMEIAKSRYQAQVLGRHPYKMISQDILLPPDNAPTSWSRFGGGFRIFQSLHRQLSKNLRPVPWTGKVSFGDQDFDKRLPSWLRGDGTSTQGRSQAPTLMVMGEFGTYKSALAINFLLSGLKTGESGLLLSLQESVAPDLRRIPQFADNEGDLGEKPDKAEKAGEEHSRGKIIRTSYYTSGKQNELSILSFRPGHLLPEEFVEATIKEIKRLQRSPGCPCRLRVVLDDTSEIPSRFPLLANSQTAARLFLPVLVDVILGLGEIPILITAAREQASNESSLSLIADVVIQTARKSLYGRDTIVVSCHAHGIEELGSITPIGLSTEGQAPSNDGTPRPPKLVVDASRFEGLIGLEGESPRRAGLGFSLYIETECQLEEADQLKSRASMLLGQEAKVKYFAPRDAESLHEAWRMWDNLPLPDTEVIMLDEFCSCPDAKEDTIGLANLQTFVSEDFRCKAPDGSNLQVSKAYRPGMVKDKPCYALPYFSNVMLLAWDSGLSSGDTALLTTLEGYGKTTTELWRRLAESDVVFDYDRRAWESEACMFMELLGQDMGALREWFRGKFMQPWLDDAVARLGAFRKLVQKTQPGAHISSEPRTASPSSLKARRPTRRTKLDKRPSLRELRRNAADPRAGVWCHWFTTLRDMLSMYPDLGPQIRVAALPFGGFRGDWYLGMASGSVSLPTGWNVIKRLCGQDRDPTKLDSGIGLPVWEASYEATDSTDCCANAPVWPNSQPTLKEIGQIWLNAHKRSEFTGYVRVHRLFREAFVEILQDPVGAGQEAERIKQILVVMHARVRAVLTRQV
jgi:KaiC/GvpD/RAD55 family RecA-like ATPase